MPHKPKVGTQEAVETFTEFKKQHREIRDAQVTPEQVAEGEVLEKNFRREKKYWDRVRENVGKAKQYGSYQDFYSILMEMVSNMEMLAKAVNASMSTMFPTAYPGSINELFTRTIPSIIASPVTGALAMKRQIGTLLDKAGFFSDYQRYVKDTLCGQISLSLDSNGVLQAGFNIQGQAVEDEAFLEKYRTLVVAYLQSKDYDLDSTADGPKVIYGPNHPRVGGPGQPAVGDVILEKDFEADLTKDNYEELRQFMKDVACNDSSLQARLGP